MLEQFIIVIKHEDYKKWKSGSILARAIEDQEGNYIGDNLASTDGQEDRYYKKRTKEISSLTVTECELANGFWMTYDAFIAHMSSDASNIKNGLLELNSFYKHFDTEKDLIIFGGIYET